MLLRSFITISLVWMGGVVVSYVTSKNISQTDEILMSNFVSVLNLLLRLVMLAVDVALTPVYFFISLPWVWVLRVALVVGCGLLVHEVPLLPLLDDMWRRVLYPAMKIGVLDVLMVFKFGFDTVVPLYNAFVVLSSQVQGGTLTLVGKCGAANLVGSAKLLTSGLVALLTTTATWSISPMGELNVTGAVWEIQQAVALQADTADCVCAAQSHTWDVLFAAAKSPSLARGVNAGLNALVAVPQEFAVLTALQPPTFRRTFDYTRSLVTNVGQFGDDIFKVMVRVPDLPPVLGVGAHVVNAGVEVLTTVVATTAYVAVPTQLLNTTLMSRVTSLRFAFVEMDRAVDRTATLLEFVLEAAQLSATQSNNVAHILRSSLRTLLGVPNSLLALCNEMLWMVVLSNEQTAIKTLQSYDGVWDDAFTLKGRPSLNRVVFTPLADVLHRLAQLLPTEFQFIEAVPKILLTTLRAALRMLLAGDQIVKGTFFNAPIGANYGLDSDLDSDLELLDAYTGAGVGECQFLPDETGSTSGSTSGWCNSMLLELVLQDIEQLMGVTDLLRQGTQCTRTATTFQETCDAPVSANTDLLCALADTVDAAVHVPLQLLRHVYATGMTTVYGYEQTSFKFGERLCDLDAVLYNLLGVLPIPFQKKAVMDALYAVLRGPVELVRGLQYLFDWITDPTVNWQQRLQQIPCSGCTQPVLGGSYDIVLVEAQLVFGYVVTLAQALEKLFESVVTGSGQFFKGMDTLLRTLKRAISVELMDVVGTLLSLGVGLLDFLTTGVVPAGMLDSVVEMFLKFTGLLAGAATEVLKGVLDMLGSFGDFLSTLINIVCVTVLDILDWIPGADLSTLRTTCEPFKVGASTSVSTIPADIFALGWTGRSSCDFAVHSYRHAIWGDLQPLEQLTLTECLQMRQLGTKLRNMTGISLPVDMFYNWQRKFEMAYSGVSAALLYYHHANTQFMIQEYRAAGVPMYWLDVFRMLTTTRVQNAVLSMRDTVVDTVTATAHRTDAEMGTDMVARVSGAAGAVGTLLEDLRATWVEHNMTHSWRHPMLGSGSGSGSGRGFGLGIGTRTTTATAALSKVHADMRVTAEKMFAWGVRSDPNPDSQCALLDNLVTVVTEQSSQLTSYYTDVYAPVTVPHFVAWLEGRDPWVNDFLEELDKTVTGLFQLPDGKILFPGIGYIPLEEAITMPNMWNFDIPGLQVQGINIGFPDGIPFGFRPPRLSDFNFQLTPVDVGQNPRYSDPSLARSYANAAVDCSDTNLTTAFECFLEQTGDAPVSYFGHNLQYIVDYQFEKCEFEQIMCNTTLTSVRIERMADALLYGLLGVTVFLYGASLLGIPAVLLVPMFGALPLIVLTHTWDWRLTCYPNIPNCLADDLYAFVETYLIPDCFCTYFPSLVGECVDTFCHFVSGSTTFAQCPDVIPEFGYLWVSFFYAKHYTPDLLRFAHYFLYQSEAFNTWMLTIDEPDRGAEQDCARLHVLDLSYPLAAVLTLFLLLPRLLPLGLRLVTTTVQLYLRLVALVYSIFLVLDQSTLAPAPLAPLALAVPTPTLPINMPVAPAKQDVDRKDSYMAGISKAVHGVGESVRLRFRQ